MKSLFIHGVILVAMGMLCGAGVLASEWLLPKPETRIVVCMYDELDRLACRNAAEILEKAGKQ